MCENFFKIPQEDQQKILKVILEEFAEKGYLRASTNTIVQKAQIPKGTLFYYFGSKKEMYLCVLDWAVARFVEFNQNWKEEPPEDLFENLLSRVKMKMEFIRREPLVYQFFYKAFLEIPEELKEDMQVRFAGYSRVSQSTALEALDRDLLRDGVDAELALKMIHLMLEGLLNRYTPRLSSLNPEEGLDLVKGFEAECRQYFQMIRTGIYH